MKALPILCVLAVLAVTATGCQQHADPSKELKPLLDKYVEVWNNGNVNDLNAIIDPHFGYHSNLSPVGEGLDGQKKTFGV